MGFCKNLFELRTLSAIYKPLLLLLVELIFLWKLECAPNLLNILAKSGMLIYTSIALKICKMNWNVLMITFKSCLIFINKQPVFISINRYQHTYINKIILDVTKGFQSFSVHKTVPGTTVRSDGKMVDAFRSYTKLLEIMKINVKCQ